MGDPVKLTVRQQKQNDDLEHIVQLAEEALKDFDGEAYRSLLDDMAQKAHELHMSLKKSGNEPVHHVYMLKNREVSSDNKDFYRHIQPVQDLLAFIKDRDANRDPEDVTLDVEFTFKVYSIRWGHSDNYTLKRTVTGWRLTFLTELDRDCDKTGAPHLFRSLEHDYIEYPSGLGDYLEYIWEQAANHGLSAEDVQARLNEVSEWVQMVEAKSPHGGFWSKLR